MKVTKVISMDKLLLFLLAALFVAIVLQGRYASSLESALSFERSEKTDLRADLQTVNQHLAACEFKWDKIVEHAVRTRPKGFPVIYLPTTDSLDDPALHTVSNIPLPSLYIDGEYFPVDCKIER